MTKCIRCSNEADIEDQDICGHCATEDLHNMTEYPQRQIYVYGKYINCQILNWNEGKPPKYLVCHPLHPDYKEQFIAKQGMGTWMKVDLVSVLAELDSHNREN